MAHLKAKSSFVRERPYDSLPAIEYLTIPAGVKRQVIVYESEIIFLIEGSLNITSVHSPQLSIAGEGGFILLPGNTYTLKPENNIHLVITRINKYFRYFETFIHSIFWEKQLTVNHPGILPIKDELHVFLNTLKEGLKKESSDSSFFKKKTEDLLKILYQTYMQEELSFFFYPLLDQKYCFASFVYNNYLKVRNIQELASAYCLSLSPFYKRFKSTFGMAAYQWVIRRKNEILLYELVNGDKILKQLADDLYFLSPSQFCDYCKKHFGSPPGKIRKEKLYYEKRKN